MLNRRSFPFRLPNHQPTSETKAGTVYGCRVVPKWASISFGYRLLTSVAFFSVTGHRTLLKRRHIWKGEEKHSLIIALLRWRTGSKKLPQCLSCSQNRSLRAQACTEKGTEPKGHRQAKLFRPSSHRHRAGAFGLKNRAAALVRTIAYPFGLSALARLLQATVY